ncbi:MAG TPA: DUF6624 domain-containing protein [Candidatus Cybelea sp.]|nr:DUF6624 domain-containing protein [Candidatus Cybelea sp.]
MNRSLRDELLAMEAEDRQVRKELLDQGALGEGYNPRLEEVHETHATRLKEIIAAHGWPGRSLAGEDGSHAAWLIAQHAVSDPPFQRACAIAIEHSIAAGEAPLAQLAYLVDRIRYFEGKPQIYGTQFRWDENGELNPWPIEDHERVDELRHRAGLNSIAERTREIREQAAREGDQGPRDRDEYNRHYESWLREVGWRK